MTLTSDDLESHIIVNVSSTLTNTTVWFVAALCLIVDVRTDVRMDGRTFLLGLFCHLSGYDLKMCTVNSPEICKYRYMICLCNRSTFAVDGAKMKVNKEVDRVIQDFHKAKKPIG